MFLLYKHMEMLSAIRKTTKTGKTSTWYFVFTPEARYVAFGGVANEMKSFPSRDEAHKCFENYLKYGYTRVDFTPEDKQLELSFSA